MMNLIAAIFHLTLFVGVVIFCIVKNGAWKFFIPAPLITLGFGLINLYKYINLVN